MHLWFKFEVFFFHGCSGHVLTHKVNVMQLSLWSELVSKLMFGSAQQSWTPPRTGRVHTHPTHSAAYMLFHTILRLLLGSVCSGVSNPASGLPLGHRSRGLFQRPHWRCYKWIWIKASTQRMCQVCTSSKSTFACYCKLMWSQLWAWILFMNALSPHLIAVYL